MTFVRDKILESTRNTEILTGAQLLEREVEERFLLDKVILWGCLGLLVGMPDSGKSMWAKCLCVHIIAGMEKFMGRKLNLKHKRVIYVSTEDSLARNKSIFFKMTKHLKDADPKAIRWIIGDDMSQFELLELLDEMIAEEPVDLVVIDGPMDLYQGRDGNSNLEMRAMMRAYNSIPQAHDCPILLIHHINKGSYHTAPQQGSVQGAGSMAQKARFVVQLDPESGSNTKYLSITKGNFLSNQEKAETIILDFDPDSFMFNATGETKSVHAIGSGKSKDESYNNPQTMENLAKTVFGEDDLLTYTELHKRIMAQMDYSDTHANRCVRSMKAFCIVEQPQPRGPYKLTSIHPSPKDMDE